MKQYPVPQALKQEAGFFYNCLRFVKTADIDR